MESDSITDFSPAAVLLGNRERRLMFHNLANRPMQGRKKSQYQERFDELPIDGAQGEQLSQQGTGVRVPVERPQV
jgi:hypothetical protein